jgi:hypothetical protein
LPLNWAARISKFPVYFASHHKRILIYWALAFFEVSATENA